ncbi:ABC transporter permease, partial [Carnobacterium maltaromaticum]|uniref:ABC transporter permease n=2 Tax=Carnobacterium TaxID=2747 RepID=UPI00191BB4B0
MNIKENFKMALDSIFANKMRSFLTMLGIIIGIASVIAILAVGNGATSEITGTFDDLGASTISLSVDNKATKGDYLTNADIQALKNGIPKIERISPDKNLTGTLSAGDENRMAIAFGGTPDIQYVNQAMDKTIVYGRFFNQNEYQDSKNVTVISEDTAAALFNGRKDVVGETVNLTTQGGTNLSLKVIGVVKGTFSKMQGSFDTSSMPVYLAMPITTMAKLDSSATNFTSLTIQVADKNDIESVSKQMVRLLETRHDAVGKDLYTATNFLQALDQVNNVLGLFINFIAAVAGIALLVGGIGVMNIMLVSVTERTREIGTRKALGATTNTILFQFLMESV